MKRILVVFTGGTIGSVISEGTIDTARSAPFKLLKLFEQHNSEPESVRFDTLQPLQILSENLAPAAWKIMIDAIESVDLNKYDGIIVTHGTDTLAYTAAALGFYFHDLNKPVLLVSSDRPLENPEGNGLANFMCAVEFIRRHIANGVFVPYRNPGQSMQIHRGSRLTCSLQLTGDFYSVQNLSFMAYDGKKFVPESQIDSSNFAQNQTGAGCKIKLHPEFSGRILMLKPYPGLDYSRINLTGLAGVLHDLYHSGTACATRQWGDDYSLIEFLKRCRQQGVEVFLAPAHRTENAYQSTRELMAHGAHMIWNMSIEAAYVKLMLAYGNFAEHAERLEFLQQTLCFEDVNL